MNRSKKRLLKKVFLSVIILFLLMNLMAIFHAYKFTHFSREAVKRTSDPVELSVLDKLKTLAFGVSNPRPINRVFPSQTHETVSLQSNKTIECWYIPRNESKGTVIIFHGFSGYKSSMLDKSDEFLAMGYNVLLVDFMGSGGSEGSQTTIGYFESEQVKSAYDYIAKRGEKKIFLFGTSMGSVAIMKSVHDFQISPSGIILECPFGSMFKTVKARFRMMNAPSFPMAGLLVFWGGIQNGFWAFGHNPIEYAKSIHCPTLLLYGNLDPKVSREETDAIFSNLQGKKLLKVFEQSGHENLLTKDEKGWRDVVHGFVDSAGNLQE